jgi:hypothetical protein
MDRDTTEAVSALLASEGPLQAPVPGPCPWHAEPLHRRQRFLLALQAPCPACRAPRGAYCRSHSGAPLAVRVHHERAHLAEHTACTCPPAAV